MMEITLVPSVTRERVHYDTFRNFQNVIEHNVNIQAQDVLRNEVKSSMLRITGSKIHSN